MVLHNCTAGRCCFYRAMLRAELPRSLVHCKFVKGWARNTIATASRWPSMAPHRGASWRATSVYSTPWPPTCSGALPTWCTIEVAPLLAFTVDAAIQDAPGAQAIRAPVSAEESTGITLEKRWFRSNGLREAPQHTARHSLQHVSICYEVRRWPTTTVRATVPCREWTATWCCSLEPLVPQTVLRQ